MGGPAAPPGTQNSTSDAPQNRPQASFTVPPMGTYTHQMGPIEFGPGGQISQTQHIHVGPVPVAVPASGEIPPEGMQLDAPLGGIPLGLPPGAIPFVPPGFGAPPQVNIRFGPPQQTNNQPGPPQSSNTQPGAPQPHQPVIIRFGRPPQAGNIRGPQLGNIRFGPPRPGQVSVVGFRMESVPIQGMGFPGGAVGMGGDGPMITPAQQQLYQQHTQQQATAPGGGGGGPRGQQNSSAGDQENSQDPSSHTEDMELD